MSIVSESTNEKDAFILPSTLDITASEKLLEKLRELSENTKIFLDASKVERITTPCIQAIISAHKTLKIRNGTLNIVNPSETFGNAFSDLGLQDELNQWSKGE